MTPREGIDAGELIMFGAFSGSIPVFKYQKSLFPGIAGDLLIRDDDTGAFSKYCPATLDEVGLRISIWLLGVEHVERVIPFEKILFTDKEWISWPRREGILREMLAKMQKNSGEINNQYYRRATGFLNCLQKIDAGEVLSEGTMRLNAAIEELRNEVTAALEKFDARLDVATDLMTAEEHARCPYIPVHSEPIVK